MPRFLIEAQHEPETLACARVVRVFLATGSHFLTHSEWGCLDGHHAAWLLVEAETKDQARALLPAAFRAEAKVVSLNRFTFQEIEEILAQHRTRDAAVQPS